MAYFSVSAITGCVEPASGGTAPDLYEQVFNDDKIISYYKKDIKKSANTNWLDLYFVIVIFENFTQTFKFLNQSNRDTFYTTLP